jgi:hypothetical protein
LPSVFQHCFEPPKTTERQERVSIWQECGLTDLAGGVEFKSVIRPKTEGTAEPSAAGVIWRRGNSCSDAPELADEEAFESRSQVSVGKCPIQPAWNRVGFLFSGPSRPRPDE